MNLIVNTQALRESMVCRVVSQKFGVVQAQRTSANPLTTHASRESKVCRVLSHKCGVVQAQRTCRTSCCLRGFAEVRVA